MLLTLLQRLVPTRFSVVPKRKDGMGPLLSLCYTLKLIGNPALFSFLSFALFFPLEERFREMIRTLPYTGN